MIYAYVYTAVISAALAATGAWQVQNWRADAHEKDRLAAQAMDQRSAYVLEQKRSASVIVAQNNGRAREARLRSDAADLRGTVDGLQRDTAAAVQASRASLDACAIAAAAIGELYVASETANRDLTEKADRHVSDIQTLMDAWPK